MTNKEQRELSNGCFNGKTKWEKKIMGLFGWVGNSERLMITKQKKMVKI